MTERRRGFARTHCTRQKRDCGRDGVIIPRTRTKDCLKIDSSSYRIRINGHVVSNGTLIVDRLLAYNLTESTNLIEGIDAVEPMQGLPARWIDSTLREQVLQLGGSYAEPVAVLATHFVHSVQVRFHELLGHQDVLRLVNDLRNENGDAITELIPSQVSISILHRLLMSLLEERVSIRRLMTIIESNAYHGIQSSDHAWLLFFGVLER